MMPKIRVLVVDDAVVVRRMVTEALASDPDIEVVGTAANGKIALAKIPQVAPDLLTMDIEMPEMDGLEAVREVRKLYPKLPVIMFSTLTERGASATLEALARGADDYVTKPANVGSVSVGRERIKSELIPKIKSLVWGRYMAKAAAPSPGVRNAVPGRVVAPIVPGTVEAVVIGVSTGGPNALATLFSELPGDLRVPILVVQHMPPIFTRLLAERLTANSKVKVREATAGDLLTPGGAWIAPGDYHMVVSRNGLETRVNLNKGMPENSCRPAVDVLFKSAAQVYGKKVLAVIMTGMGQDGLNGCTHVKDAGGPVIIQDEASSVVWGMPGAVSRANLADRTLPLNQLAREIVRVVGPGLAKAA